MPLQHFLPATFLAFFSEDTTSLPRRSRLISVGDKKTLRVDTRPAANAAAENQLYTLFEYDDPELLDKLWTEYEGKLDHAIISLISGELDAKTWIRILVPFVTSLLVRGPDFNTRFENRIKELGIDSVSKDNTNAARMIELQRLLGPVAAAQWIVMKVNGKEPLITNDLGYAPFFSAPTQEYGIALPLDLTHILGVIPRDKGVVVRAIPGKWVPEIIYAEDFPDNHEVLNEVISNIAGRFIFGPNEDIIKKRLAHSGVQEIRFEPEQLGFLSGHFGRAYEFTWHRLASALEREPDDELSWDFTIDFEKLAQGWIPVNFSPINLVEFPSAVRREGDAIIVEFSNPEMYYTLRRLREFQSYSDDFVYSKDAKSTIDLVLKDCIELINWKKEDPEFHFEKGKCHLLLGKYHEAITEFDMVLQIDRNNAVSQNNRGISWFCLGEYSQAIKDYGVAAELFGQSSAAGSPLRYLALCHAINGNIKAAKRCFSKAKLVDNKSPENLFIQGLLDLYEGCYVKSLELFRLISKYNGNYPGTMLFQSLPLAFMGQVDDALEIVNQCKDQASPVIGAQFNNHLRALKNLRPKKKTFLRFFEVIYPVS